MKLVLQHGEGPRLKEHAKKAGHEVKRPSVLEDVVEPILFGGDEHNRKHPVDGDRICEKIAASSPPVVVQLVVVLGKRGPRHGTQVEHERLVEQEGERIVEVSLVVVGQPNNEGDNKMALICEVEKHNIKGANNESHDWITNRYSQLIIIIYTPF